MNALPEQRLSLEDAINQLISLGESDPLTIARRLPDLHGYEWVALELAAHAEDILAEIARQRLGSVRRNMIVSISERAKQGSVTKREAVLATLYVPKVGYVKLGEATADDLLAAAFYRRRLAQGLVRWSDWLESLAAQVREQGVSRVRELRGPLPDLPAGELEP